MFGGRRRQTTGKTLPTPTPTNGSTPDLQGASEPDTDVDLSSTPYRRRWKALMELNKTLREMGLAPNFVPYLFSSLNDFDFLAPIP
jgi:hypothetical protein